MTGEPGVASIPVIGERRGAGMSEASARPAAAPTSNAPTNAATFSAKPLDLSSRLEAPQTRKTAGTITTRYGETSRAPIATTPR